MLAHSRITVLLVGLCTLTLCVAAQAATITIGGGSLTTTNGDAWGGISRTTFDTEIDLSAGPTTITVSGLDLNDILYTGPWSWPPVAADQGAQARFGVSGSGFWSLHSIHSAIGGGSGSWDQQTVKRIHDDGFRKYLIQNQWSGTTVGVTVGNHQYNAEALIAAPMGRRHV